MPVSSFLNSNGVSNDDESLKNKGRIFALHNTLEYSKATAMQTWILPIRYLAKPSLKTGMTAPYRLSLFIKNTTAYGKPL